MKIKVIEKNYQDVLAMGHAPHIKPKKPNIFFRTLLKLVSLPDLLATRFSVKRIGMQRLDKREPCLFLVNHSSFIDLEIVASTLYPRPFNIVATTDGFVGKDWLMRQIGCIPCKKFMREPLLVRDMLYTTRKLGSSIVLFPEAGYTFDGTATAIPDNLGAAIKLLGVPVVMLKTYGAFLRDPLYNNLQRRKVRVSATEEFIFSKQDLAVLSPEEIQKKIQDLFTFDEFAWQKENGVRVTESFRADRLDRILYKCPACGAEEMVGRGTRLSCRHCQKEYFMTELGELKALDGNTELSHIPDWYRWEREEVKREILAGGYEISLPVDIYVMQDTRALYRVGVGRLSHTIEGLHLVGCGGKLNFTQKPLASHSLNSDFNWYEMGDVVCIGNADILYYCFPKGKKNVVAKMRLAAEEIYKIEKAKKEQGNAKK